MTSEARILDVLNDLERIDWPKLRDRLIRLNRRDSTGFAVPDGHKRRTISGDIPANDPEALTPVEAAADSRAFGGRIDPDTRLRAPQVERDEVHECNVMAFSFLEQALGLISSAGDQIRRADEVQTWHKPIGHQAPQCRSEGCDRPAVARGWCNACRMWIHRNPAPDGLDPLTVPAHVITERSKTREKAS